MAPGLFPQLVCNDPSLPALNNERGSRTMSIRIVVSLLVVLVTITACGQSVTTPTSATLPTNSVTADSIETATSATGTAVLATAAPPVVETATFVTSAYQGPPVPTPHALDQSTTARPAWLVVGDQLIPGTRGSSGTGDAVPSSVFLNSIVKVAFPDQTPLTVIVSTTPVERVSAGIEPWGENMPDRIVPVHTDSTYPNVFILEPPQDIRDQILTVYVRFGPGQDVMYHWRLNAVSE